MGVVALQIIFDLTFKNIIQYVILKAIVKTLYLQYVILEDLVKTEVKKEMIYCVQKIEYEKWVLN